MDLFPPSPIKRVFLALFVAANVSAGVLAPTSALAGGYDVHACASGFNNGANNSFAAQTDNGMTAYTECPAGQGVTTRNVYDGGRSGAFQGAYMIFDSPPGTSVGSIAYDAGFERADCAWSVGVAQSNGDLGGSYVWALRSGQDCQSWSTPGATAFFPYHWFFPISGTRVRFEARCGAAQCSRNGTNAIRAKDITVHVNDDAAPTLLNGRGGLWTSNGWVSGRQAVGFDAADGSGISRTAVRIDGNEVANRLNACDYTQRAPCPASGLDSTIATAGLTDGRHAVTLSAVDAAGNEGTVSRDISIDNTAPDPPHGLVVDGGDGWRSSNDFDLRWTTPTATGAPVAAAIWDLCPVSGSCVRGSKGLDGSTELQHFTVPSAGAWTLRLWFRDAAGNEDPRLAASPVQLRFDDVSPDLSFSPLSADDPTRVAVDTSDKGSGVASGQIDVRRLNSTTWIPLATVVEGTQLVARIDDEHLADGRYELRAQATDQAGNQRSTQGLADGSPAQFTLPLRLKTRLRVGIVRRHGRRSRVVRAASVGYGTLVRVRGRLATPEGNPMQNVAVTAYSQVKDGITPRRLLATVQTSKTGRFSFLVRRGPSRVVVVRYSGAAQIRGVARDLQLNVRAATSIKPDRHRVLDGEDVRFVGRVRTGRIPAKGKLVEMQVYVRGKWRTFATTRAARRGHWRYAYRFDGTRGSQDYRFRAKLPPEAGYPFASGVSHVVRVHVRGA